MLVGLSAPLEAGVVVVSGVEAESVVGFTMYPSLFGISGNVVHACVAD